MLGANNMKAERSRESRRLPRSCLVIEIPGGFCLLPQLCDLTGELTEEVVSEATCSGRVEESRAGTRQSAFSHFLCGWRCQLGISNPDRVELRDS